jgi:hypothetical protein
MACDDLVFDLVVSSRGKDAAGHKLVLGGIGAAVNDALGVGIADPGEGLELVRGRGVDVQRCSCCGCRSGCFRSLGGGENGNSGKEESNGEEFATKIEHRRVSLWDEYLTAEEYESARVASMNNYDLPYCADLQARRVELTSGGSKATLKWR